MLPQYLRDDQTFFILKVLFVGGSVILNPGHEILENHHLDVLVLTMF